MPALRTAITRFALCGWIAGGLLLLVVVEGAITNTDSHEIVAGPAEFRFGAQNIEFTVVTQGDAGWFRKHNTRAIWTGDRSAWRAPTHPDFEIRDARGTLVPGRQIYLSSPTWWLLVFCMLPGLCCQAASSRARRAARMANCCHFCGYDLRGSPIRCPECGTDKDPGDTQVNRINARMWRRRPIATTLAALSLLAAAIFGGIGVGAHYGIHTRAAITLPYDCELRINGESIYVSNHASLNGYDRGSEWMGVALSIDDWSTYGGPSITKISLTVHTIYLFILSLVPPIWWWCLMRRDQRLIAARGCKGCGHDMNGATGPCPQCGKVR